MSVTFIKAAAALIPVSILLVWSVAVLLKGRTLGPVLQLLGAVCLVVVVLTHVAEGLHVFRFMHWGEEHSAGHYLDLSSAVLGVTLFPLGLLLRIRAKPRARASA